MTKGKAGDHLPLDVEVDFEKPTTKPGSDAEAEVTGKQEDDSKQAELPMDKPPETPKLIRNKKMYGQFVQAVLDHHDDPCIVFHFSLSLTPDHEDYIPEELFAAYKIVKRGHCKRYDPMPGDVAPQTIVIALYPELTKLEEERETQSVTLVAADISNASIQVIQESGAGKSKDVIRLTFRAIVDREKAVLRFASTHDGKDVWITMKDTQARLLKEKDKD